jgi:hypothetical protein
MFKSIFGSKSGSVPPSKLPQLNAFVDAIVGGRPSRSVTVESVGPKGIVTKESLGKAGETAVLVYTATAGRFRAQTKVVSVGANSTQFEMPRRVTLIGAAAVGAQKRQSVRLDAIVSGYWRFAPKGVGTGEWARCSIRDISRGGCSLIIDRALKHHAEVEVKVKLKPDGPDFVFFGEVMRHEQIKTSGKHSHGLRFHGIRPEEDQAIVDFINRRQADLRSRGLA